MSIPYDHSPVNWSQRACNTSSDQAVAGLRSTELERAREIWRRKFGAPPADAAERGKQTRFLAARGFGGDVIRRVLAGAE